MGGISDSGIISSPAVCGALDVMGHTCSLFYYLYDNILWAASVGIFRSKEVPQWQRKMWQGGRREGPTLQRLGGVAMIKRRKNQASIWRLNCAITANVLLFRVAVLRCWTRGGRF